MKKQKHKKSKSENQFIEEQGIQIYNKILEENPGIENDPDVFDFLNKIAKFYQPPVMPSLKRLHDRYFGDNSNSGGDNNG